MKKILLLLSICIFISLSFSAFAQNKVQVNQVRKFTLADRPTSKYSWEVAVKTVADPSDLDPITGKPKATYDIAAAAGKYKFVTSYFDLTEVSVDVAKQELHTVYILWLGNPKDELTIIAKEFDIASECSDDKYNVYPIDVVIEEAFRAWLAWDVITTDINGDGEVNGKDILDPKNTDDFKKLPCADITSTTTEDVTDPVSGKTTTIIKDAFSTISFTLNVENQRKNEDWKYYYKYIKRDVDAGGAPDPLLDTEPKDAEWDAVASIPAGEVFLPVDGATTSSPISLEKLNIAKGDGYANVWVKIIKIYDGYGSDGWENPKSVLVAKASMKRIPAAQTITLEE